ncbi:hypothetical protein AB0L40_08085 [Patulibacter sp. NPDC049589]|uniref:hypothetical protein n=1 Tax=Patulibacter sp. NPDC049589 TaxID=3154731 RepID=UPI003413C359
MVLAIWLTPQGALGLSLVAGAALGAAVGLPLAWRFRHACSVPAVYLAAYGTTIGWLPIIGAVLVAS